MDFLIVILLQVITETPLLAGVFLMMAVQSIARHVMQLSKHIVSHAVSTAISFQPPINANAEMALAGMKPSNA